MKERYCCQFIITGGDSLSNYSAEYVEIDGQIHVVKSKKRKTTSTHGSGCVFSSALTIFLAKGHTTLESIKKTKRFINQQINCSPILNVQYGPLI